LAPEDLLLAEPTSVRGESADEKTVGLTMAQKGVRNQKEPSDAVCTASATPLERFLIENEIKPLHLATACGYSRQHILGIRTGEREPTRRCMAAILAGLRSLTRRQLTVLDIFEFEDGPAERPGGE
jgi:hypothetical protein